MNNFPTRVKRSDVDRNNRRFDMRKKPENSDVKVFSRGARQYLHPSLSILDSIDCELVYYKTNKIITVSYSPSIQRIDNTDYTEKVYDKCVMSGDVSFIVNIIKEYKEDLRGKQNRDYNEPINSRIQSEPIDITTEEIS